jgi:small subunit ribosomal protein S2
MPNKQSYFINNSFNKEKTMNRREKLFEAGVQFGHRTQCWCPKMAPFIWGKKDGIHLINVALTDMQLTKAEKTLEAIAAKGLPILWVGTKKIARNIVSKFAQECNSPFFANRWVGGTLTNYQEVKKAVKKMLYNEEIYQKSESQDIYTKKELNLLQKKVQRSKKIISGIEKLSYPIGALIVTDVQKDKVAVKEAIRIGVPVIGLVDTNADPEGITIVIPTNDDLEDSLSIIAQYLSNAINKGKEIFTANNKLEAEKQLLEKTEEKKSGPQKTNNSQNQTEKAKKTFLNKTKDSSASSTASSSNSNGDNFEIAAAQNQSPSNPERPIQKKTNGDVLATKEKTTQKPKTKSVSTSEKKEAIKKNNTIKAE